MKKLLLLIAITLASCATQREPICDPIYIEQSTASLTSRSAQTIPTITVAIVAGSPWTTDQITQRFNTVKGIYANVQIPLNLVSVNVVPMPPGDNLDKLTYIKRYWSHLPADVIMFVGKGGNSGAAYYTGGAAVSERKFCMVALGDIENEKSTEATAHEMGHLFGDSGICF